MTSSPTPRVSTPTAAALVLGAALVTAGLLLGAVSTVVVGVALPVVVAWVDGPLMRWLRRGEGPHATRSDAEAAREEYLRMRYAGGHSHGL